MILFKRLLCLIVLSIFIYQPALAQQQINSLKGKVICIDPGHGGTAGIDSYRVGPSGEREEWINLRVGLALKQLLERKEAEVVMTREKDVNISLSERVRIAVEHQADVFISIHHNATADSAVNFPIIYFHGNASENQAGVLLGKFMIKSLSKELYNNENPASLASDHTIFPGSGTAVLRGTYGIPGILVEASFFTNPMEEQRLKNPDYNHREAQAYLKALQLFFSREEALPILDKNSQAKVKPFRVLQEEERMKPIARKWKSNFIEGYRLYQKGDSLSLRNALEYFTISARSFPDSWLARQAHLYRAKILGDLGKNAAQHEAQKRVDEYYVPLHRNNKYLDELF